MNATVSEIIGVFAAIVVLAGVTVALTSKTTPAVVGAVGGTFYKSIAVATQQKVPK
jgi:hypothetical protein